MQQVKEERPDIILLDINLNEEIDGVQIGALVTQDYNVPFIYVTAFADKETIERG